MPASESRETRRRFVQAGMGLSAALSGPTALAADGGPRTVTVPAQEHARITRWPRYGPAEKRALHELIDRGDFYGELPRFEKAWREYVKAPYAKAHMNCTSALTSGFFALDLPPGSEVLVPSYTFFATVAPMRFFGYVPVFVDVDPRTCCFDVSDAARKLTKRTRAMVPMHAWGLPCEMDQVMDFAGKHGLLVLEDAAQSAGARMRGKMTGTFGQIGVWSFQTSKVMPTIEGGIGVYQTRELYERAATYGHYEDPPKFAPGSPMRKYEGTGFGQKFRMHPFAAAVGLKQLESLEERHAQVEKHVRKLNDRILQLPGLSEPRVRKDQRRVYYHANMLFLDQAKAGFNRDQLVKALKAEGVRASVWVYPVQHEFTLYSEARWWHHKPEIPASLPGSEQVNRDHIFVALHYEEAPELLDQYARAFEKVWANRSQVARLSV